MIDFKCFQCAKQMGREWINGCSYCGCKVFYRTDTDAKPGDVTMDRHNGEEARLWFTTIASKGFDYSFLFLIGLGALLCICIGRCWLFEWGRFAE